MILSSILALVTVKSVVAAVVGFIVRHVSPAFLAKVKALWARVTGKVVAVETKVVAEVKTLEKKI